MELKLENERKNELGVEMEPATGKHKYIKIDTGLEHRSERIYGPFDIYDLNFHPKHTYISAYSGDISLQIEILWSFKKDTERFGPIHQVRVPPSIWRHEKLPLKSQWFSIRISRTSLQVSSEGSVSNNLLHVELRSMKPLIKQVQVKCTNNLSDEQLSQSVDSLAQLSSTCSESLDLRQSKLSRLGSCSPTPQITIIEEERTSSEVKRSSSPFRRHSTSKGGFFSKEKKKTTTTVPVATSSSSTLFDSRLPSFIPEGALLIGGKNGRLELIPKAACGGLSMVSDEMGKGEWSHVYPPKLPNN